MIRILADSETLMSQAPGTVAFYMREGVEQIDRLFGDGYAKAHPELLAAFITASATDMHGAIIAGAIEAVAGTIGEQGIRFDDIQAISNSLDAIASSIADRVA